MWLTVVVHKKDNSWILITDCFYKTPRVSKRESDLTLTLNFDRVSLPKQARQRAERLEAQLHAIQSSVTETHRAADATRVEAARASAEAAERTRELAALRHELERARGQAGQAISEAQGKATHLGADLARCGAADWNRIWKGVLSLYLVKLLCLGRHFDFSFSYKIGCNQSFSMLTAGEKQLKQSLREIVRKLPDRFKLVRRASQGCVLCFGSDP